ncbi:MAG: hypothetical protein CM15mP120_21480 [Pseudomonadota bacterium]|nr:MAG: hypothetical protein CM15mP120_21480 [Pseudomonadota bacterium]
MVVMDAIARHLPGTLGNQMSALDESYLDATLDYPHYTRPKPWVRKGYRHSCLQETMGRWPDIDAVRR